MSPVACLTRARQACNAPALNPARRLEPWPGDVVEGRKRVSFPPWTLERICVGNALTARNVRAKKSRKSVAFDYCE
jgi:hypothetical protein